MSTNMSFTNKVVQVLPPAVSRAVLQYSAQYWNLLLCEIRVFLPWILRRRLWDSEDEVHDRGSSLTCLCLWPRPPLLRLPALQHAASLFFMAVDPAAKWFRWFVLCFHTEGWWDQPLIFQYTVWLLADQSLHTFPSISERLAREQLISLGHIHTTCWLMAQKNVLYRWWQLAQPFCMSATWCPDVLGGSTVWRKGRFWSTGHKRSIMQETADRCTELFAWMLQSICSLLK